jgi:hypothetical protein
MGEEEEDQLELRREVVGSLDNLHGLITERPGRMEHLLPDLALKMLAIQTLQHGRATATLAQSQLNSWAFPSARAAFEASADLAYLAFADSAMDYDRLGAQVLVAAERAVSVTHGKSKAAVPALQGDESKQPQPLKKRVQLLIDHWAPYRRDADAIVAEACDIVEEAWKSGRKHWSGMGRESVHGALRDRFSDHLYGRVMDSWYDILAGRSHPGAHSPGMKWEAGNINFLLDHDQENPIPLATVKAATGMAILSLRHAFSTWGAG